MGWVRFIRRKRRDEDFVQEILAHIEHEVDMNIEAGMSAREARSAALRKFGNVTAIKERVHEMNSIGFLEAFLQDLRHGLRWLRLNPGFATVAIMSLALGIGANTAIFQLIDAVRMRSLPVRNPQELAEVRIAPPRSRSGSFSSRRPEFTYPMWEQFQQRQQSFSTLFAWSATNFDLSSGGEARNVEGLWVSGEFFDALHVPPVRGRMISVSDDIRGCSAPGVVVSTRFWQREFGGREGAVGGQVSLDGRSFEIIGIIPTTFFGMEVGRTFDVAMPLCARGLWAGRDVFNDRSEWWLAVAGRLRGGVTLEQATADVKGVSAGIFEETVPTKYTTNEAESYKRLKLTTVSLGTGVSALRIRYETPLWILLATTGLVLLIACANIANLMLARTSSRQREISIRLAIGASRSRLVRQLLAESMLLAVLGAILGLFVAQSLSRFLVIFLSSDTTPLMLTLHMDWTVLGYTAGLVVLTCLVFGVMPAIRGTRVGPGAVLKAAGRGLTGDRQRFGIRRAIVVSQVALSLVLLIGALLFARSLRNLVNLESGYQPQGVLFVNVDLQRLKAEPERRLSLFDQLLEGFRAVPDVQTAATVSHTPMVTGWNNHVRSTAAGSNAAYVLSNFARVSDEYFGTIGTTRIGGRDFDRSDTASSGKVAIVDDAFVRQVFNGSNPIGSRFELEADPGKPAESFEVVGVVENVKSEGLRSDFQPTAYLPESQERNATERQTFAIRSSARLTVLIPALKETVRDLHPAIGLEFQPFDTIIRDSLVSERLMATLSSFFGLLAAALATIGLYGTLSYTVTQRRNEIGIRIALGADRQKVVRMVLWEATLLLAVGLALGTFGALITARTASTLLYGLTPNDPLTIAMSIFALAIVTLAASYLPARRAANLQPSTVLREE